MEFEHDRTRTCNPQIRSLVPYPLGHMPSMSVVDCNYDMVTVVPLVSFCTHKMLVKFAEHEYGGGGIGLNELCM